MIEVIPILLPIMNIGVDSMRIKSEHKKYLITLIVVIAMFIFYAIDMAIAGAYKMTIIETEPSVAIADGKSYVKLVVKVENMGNVVVGHTINAIASAGSFKNQRAITGQKGEVIFYYIPYLSSKYTKVSDVNLKFSDENNSIFISYPASCEKTIKLIEPIVGGEKNDSVDSIFK